MNIQSTLEDKKLTVTIDGAFDYAAALEFKNYMSERYKGVWELVIDLGAVKYISSAGMRELLASELVMKKRGGMKLKNVGEDVWKVISMVGFDRFLVIES